MDKCKLINFIDFNIMSLYFICYLERGGKVDYHKFVHILILMTLINFCIIILTVYLCTNATFLVFTL